MPLLRINVHVTFQFCLRAQWSELKSVAYRNVRVLIAVKNEEWWQVANPFVRVRFGADDDDLDPAQTSDLAGGLIHQGKSAIHLAGV